MIVLQLFFLFGFAALFASAGIHAWRTGRMPLKMGSVSRRKNPILFWLTITTFLLLAAVFLAGPFILKP